MIKADVENLRRLLADATAAIGQDYFMLPIADAKGGKPILRYRERVYAYELYHQLRCRWPAWSYSLGGEIDKSCHPIIRDPPLKAAKPDLLVHVPGEMSDNLAVIEIKPATLAAPPNEQHRFHKDLRKLVAFRQWYPAAFLLVFGESLSRTREYAEQLSGTVDLSLVELWHHPKVGVAAESVAW